MLLALGRSLLDTNDASSYTPVYDYLSRASHLVNASPSVNPNWVRCVGGAFHLVAGSLYQSGKYGASVRFLKESCILGKKALALRSGVEMRADDKEDAWKALSEQLFRRWELLAACYVRTGEKKVNSFFWPASEKLC